MQLNQLQTLTRQTEQLFLKPVWGLFILTWQTSHAPQLEKRAVNNFVFVIKQVEAHWLCGQQPIHPWSTSAQVKEKSKEKEKLLHSCIFTTF